MNPNKDENASEYCKYLNDPLNVTDLIGNGASFQLNSNLDDEKADKLCAELNFDDNDYTEDEEKNCVMNNSLKMQLTRPFDELRTNMEKINKLIYKKIIKVGNLSNDVVPLNAIVGINYHAYCELDTKAFDSTYLRGVTQIFKTGHNEILEGIEAAVLTMRLGEEAQFIISYKLLFGEMGCPPRIKPHTDCLYVIKVKSFDLLDDENVKHQVTEDEQQNFNSIIANVKELHLSGLKLFKQDQFQNACQTFEKAIHLLKYCHLKNEDEERVQVQFLLKLYTNITVLYNKINLPKKVCIVSKEIRRLTNNEPSCKALYQEGRALIALGDYGLALNLLHKAELLEPHNVLIKKELESLEKRFVEYKINEQNLYKKALGFIKVNKTEECKRQTNLEEFESEIIQIIESFVGNDDVTTIKLPFGLVKEELEIVDKIAKRYKFSLKIDKAYKKLSYLIERD